MLYYTDDTLGTGEDICARCGTIYDCFTTDGVCRNCGDRLSLYDTVTSGYKYDVEPEEQYRRVINPLPLPPRKIAHPPKMIGKPQELKCIRPYIFK